MDTFSKVQDGFHIKTVRRVAICLTFNDETDESDGVTFRTPWTHFVSGTADVPLPGEFTTGQSLVWGARKTYGLYATGTVGVFTYNSSDGKTLAVMWSVPFDFNIFYSWWNVKMYRGTRQANYTMYEEMYRDAKCKGDNNWYGPREIGQGYTMNGSMANSSLTSLEIHVTKIKQTVVQHH